MDFLVSNILPDISISKFSSPASIIQGTRTNNRTNFQYICHTVLMEIVEKKHLIFKDSDPSLRLFDLSHDQRFKFGHV